MKAQHIFILLLFFVSAPLFAKLPFNIFNCTLSGYIKAETYTDSRQTRGDEIIDISFFPKPQELDPAGHDINAQAATYMDAFESRTRVTMEGLKMRDATIKGLIEADFEVFYSGITNIPHLRHAYLTLDWKRASLLLGHTWHPVVFLESKTINYNGSTPFDFYARCPQLAFTYHTSKNVDLIAVAASQVDYDNDGPYGYDSDYIRWALVPNLHLQCKWFLKNHTMSFGFDYRRLTPRLKSDTDFKVNEHINSIAAIWYLGLKWPSIEVNTKVNWGQNVNNYNGIGGFAVREGSADPITDHREYTNISAIGAWMDIEIVKNKKIKPAIFIAYTQNLGSSQPIDFDIVDNNNVLIERRIYGFVPDVHNVIRISSRLTSDINNMTFAGEVEYTRAAYGTITRSATVINTTPAELIRCTFAAYYYF